MSAATMTFRFAESVEEATSLLRAHGDEARLVCGGTATALFLRQGLIAPELLIGIGRIGPLRETSLAASGTLRVGAAVRVREAELDPRIAAWEALAEALAHVATPRIRMMATIGGGIAHADPAQDPIVALSALDASVLLAGAGRSSAPIATFFRGYYEPDLRAGEMIVGVEVPPPPPRFGSAYLKFLPRSVDDYGTVTAAAAIALEADGRVTHARLALGSVGPTPIAVPVEAVLAGATDVEGRIADAATLAFERVDPLDDVRGTAGYKRDMAVVFARRALTLAFGRARAAAQQPPAR